MGQAVPLSVEPRRLSLQPRHSQRGCPGKAAVSLTADPRESWQELNGNILSCSCCSVPQRLRARFSSRLLSL